MVRDMNGNIASSRPRRIPIVRVRPLHRIHVMRRATRRAEKRNKVASTQAARPGLEEEKEEVPLIEENTSKAGRIRKQSPDVDLARIEVATDRLKKQAANWDWAGEGISKRAKKI